MHEFREHHSNVERELSGVLNHAQINLCDIVGPADNYPVNYRPINNYPVDNYPINNCPFNNYPFNNYPINDYPLNYYPIYPSYPAADYHQIPWQQTSATHCDNSINANRSEGLQEHHIGENKLKSEPNSLCKDAPLTGAAREEQCRVELLQARHTYGSQSIEVAEKLIRLGDSCEDQSKRSESENYYRQAAGIAQKFGDNPEAADLLLDLSRRADKHGKYEEADRWEDKAYDIFDRIPTPYY